MSVIQDMQSSQNGLKIVCKAFMFGMSGVIVDQDVLNRLKKSCCA